MQSISVLGLGAMGSRMAERLIKAGYDVHVWNRSPNPMAALRTLGATTHATPKAAAHAGDVVIAMVTDDDASRDLWLQPDSGALYGLKPNALAIESSTLSPSWVTQLADKVNKVAAFLEAPVVGSRPQAEAGGLIYLVGGDSKWQRHAQDILNTMGNLHLYCGTVGTATAFKLAVNAFFAIQTTAMAELLNGLTAHGMTKPLATELFAQLPVTSPVAKGISQLMVSQTYEPLFPIELVVKDLEYQAGLNEAAKAPLTHLTAQLFQQAKTTGLGHENIHAIAKLF